MITKKQKAFLWLSVGLLLYGGFLAAYWSESEGERLVREKRHTDIVRKTLDSLAHTLEQKKVEAFKERYGTYYRDTLSKTSQMVMQDLKVLKSILALANRGEDTYQQKIAAYKEFLKAEEMLKSVKITCRLTREYEELNRATVCAERKNIVALKIKQMMINRRNSKGKERQGGSYREENIQSIKIYCTFADDKAVQIGQKSIMMLLKDETGSTLVPPVGSGRFKINGQETTYTAAQSFLFDNSRQSLVFNYQKDNPLGKGKFTVELYSEGQRIGTGSFTVR